jgi:hypothetical protein
MSSFLIDDRSWAISELVVDAGSWISGKEVRISPDRVDRISYEDSKVFVNLTKADVEKTADKGVATAASGDRLAKSIAE